MVVLCLLLFWCTYIKVLVCGGCFVGGVGVLVVCGYDCCVVGLFLGAYCLIVLWCVFFAGCVGWCCYC